MRPRAPEDLVPLEETVPASVFRTEVDAWARRIGVTPREVRLRPMKRKWASCSASSRLTFDTGLLREPARVRARVIVHELLHLKVPNHGRVFKALLRSHLGDGGDLFWRRGSGGRRVGKRPARIRTL